MVSETADPGAGFRRYSSYFCRNVRRLRADFLVDESPHHREPAGRLGLAAAYNVVPASGSPEGQAEVMKSSYCTSLVFIRIPLRVVPLEKGGRGEYPSVTTAWCAVPGRLSSAELSHRPNILAIPFNPPGPPSQGRDVPHESSWADSC